jgi:hypothetical protein
VRIRSVPLIFSLMIGLPCLAQSNSEVDALLAQGQARIDSAAYMVLVAGGEIEESSTPDAAYAMLQEKAWLSAAKQASAPIRLDDYCALVMRSLGLKGGLMYSIFPGPRYAYRELVAKGIVNASGGPKRSLPGDEVLKILRQAMELKGAGR